MMYKKLLWQHIACLSLHDRQQPNMQLYNIVNNNESTFTLKFWV